MKFRLLLLFVCLVTVGFLISGQPAMAQSPHHIQVRVVSGDGHVALRANAKKEKKALEQLSSGFGVLPPVDGGGNDEWPCFPNQNANGADCSQIATGGVVIGTPAYSQSLSACDANSGSSPNCGQVFWFYEDDTGDTTDDLVVSIVVKQGKNFVLDTGPFNFGANPFGSAPGTVIVISDDTAFGTLGESGPGNGFCAGSTETCVNPVAGVASVTVTTTVGTSTITSKFNMFLE